MKMKTLVAVISFCVAVQAAIDFDNVVHMEQIVELPGMPSSHGKPPQAGRIVGGKVAEPGQFPHQCGVFMQLGDQQAFCGSSILSPNYILTAAHCAEGVSNFTVVCGTNKMKTDDPGRVERQSNQVVIHPEWSMSTLRNDIAIIRLPEPLELNDLIQTVRLPRRSDVGKTFEGEQSIISGWGKDKDSATSISDVLRYSENHILENKKCSKLLLGMPIPQSQVCQSGKGKRGACSGDSGGPLIAKEDDGKPVQIGITSYGVAFGCALGLPTSYTRVSEYFDFIEANSDVVLRA